MNKVCEAIDKIPQNIAFIDRSYMYGNCLSLSVQITMTIVMFTAMLIGVGYYYYLIRRNNLSHVKQSSRLHSDDKSQKKLNNNSDHT